MKGEENKGLWYLKRQRLICGRTMIKRGEEETGYFK